jgi:hypothetical protein
MYSWDNTLLEEAALSDEISLFLYIMMSHRSDMLG